jgi:hypothetical protein
MILVPDTARRIEIPDIEAGYSCCVTHLGSTTGQRYLHKADLEMRLNLISYLISKKIYGIDLSAIHME